MAATSAIALATAWNAVDARAALDAHAHPFQGHRSMVVHGSLAPSTDHHKAIAGTPTPARLTRRILYLPSHNAKATHLPVYDFTADFNRAVKDEPLGSSRFKTVFGLMPKPCGDGRGSSSVSYLLDFEPLEARMMAMGGGLGGAPPPPAGRRKSSFGVGGVTKATVTRRMLYAADVEVGLTIQPHAAPGMMVEDGAAACTLSPASTTLEIPVLTSFPVAPTVTRLGSSRNAWFTFTVQSLLDEGRTMQWQVHPTKLGMLRYTLVEIPNGVPPGVTVSASRNAATDEIPYSAADPANEHRIRAIYHNVGLGFSLSQPYSEGVLLLQDGFDPELEALVLASLIGLLWKVRSEECKPRKMSKSEASGKPARRTSVGEAEPASPPEKKGRLLSKILRKKSA